MNSLKEWENVLESEIWQLKEAELDIFPHLLLSYNELSPDLKRCFSYCAIYPKDYSINVKYLIEVWMALGYLGRVTGNDGAEGKGQDYFNSLAMRCLFQDIDFAGELCKMHDIVHDFAQFLRKNSDRAEAAGVTERSCQVCNPLLSHAREYRSLFWGKESPTSICDCVASVRVLRLEGQGLLWGCYVDGFPPGMEKLIHLRVLELSGRLSRESLNIICRFYFLQNLRLSFYRLEEIPSEIENLVELRLLDLSYNSVLKELPDSMCSLVELKVLNIQGRMSLSRLPEGIHRLQNLQHLTMNDTTPVRHHLPQGVGQLNGLHTFGENFNGGGSGSNKLGLLKGLNLSGSLELRIQLYFITDMGELVEDAREAELRNKVHVQTLVLHFDVMNEANRSSSMWVDVIEALEPHQKVRKVGIMFYPGSRLPRWISSPHNLVKKIHLVCLRELTLMPATGKLPFLEVLEMWRVPKLKMVGRELLGFECSSTLAIANDAVVAFPSLKKLEFDKFPEWSEWEDITAEEEESVAVSIMPSLTELNIKNCNGLKKLPHRLLRKVSSSSSLEFLNIEDSKELKANYGFLNIEDSKELKANYGDGD